ncbi:hypothetical protein TWF481_009476 [Arthrobotrys musiformis]|uniref:Uncharacterized protein n=1 Tax=Arthrobotrys musiformis TaxID=47236 RepID=A0AAV9W6D6_9PEZI
MENLPRGRRSRRSSSNLNLSNISPLTTHFSMTAVDDHLAMTSPQTSYIQGASAPSTPSILSRNPSRKPSRPRIPPLSVPATPRGGDIKLYKAKSASHLVVDRRTSSYFDPRTRRNESTEWVHRAGIALTSEARESKGQSWLTSRASSTSLLSNGSDTEDDVERLPRRASKSYSEFYTPRSRNASDATIRRRSRSRQQEGVHPLAPEFIDEAFAGDSFEDDDDYEGSDYALEELDDEELHWSKRPRTGLGAWVDRMVGWSLFSVDDEIDSDEDHEQEHPATKEAHEPPRLNIPNFETGKASPEEQPASPEYHDAGVLSDVGWVLGLTVKVFLQG